MANDFNIEKLLQNTLPLPIYPIHRQVGIVNPGDYEGAIESVSVELADQTEYTIFGTPMVMPLAIKLQSEDENAWWLFPTEPLITISGGNKLAKRSVAKKETRGTIKERWAQDDYRITIQGVLTSIGEDLRYPDFDVRELFRKFCEAREAIDVKCPVFETLSISRIVIENYELPFTKGAENQNFKIEAVSDDDWELLRLME